MTTLGEANANSDPPANGGVTWFAPRHANRASVWNLGRMALSAATLNHRSLLRIASQMV